MPSYLAICHTASRLRMHLSRVVVCAICFVPDEVLLLEILWGATFVTLCMGFLSRFFQANKNKLCCPDPVGLISSALCFSHQCQLISSPAYLGSLQGEGLSYRPPTALVLGCAGPFFSPNVPNLILVDVAQKRTQDNRRDKDWC